VEADPTNPNVLYLGAATRNYRVGATVGPHGMYKTTDRGETWQVVTRQKSYQSWLCVKSRAKEMEQQGENVKGTFWTDMNGAKFISVCQGNPNIVYFSTFDAAYKTEDGGKTWADICTDKMPDGSFKGRGNCNVVPVDLAFDPFDRTKLYLGACDYQPFITHDVGRTFVRTKGLRGGGFVLAADPAKSNTVYAGGGQWEAPRLWRSTDGGRGFETLSFPFGKKGLPRKPSFSFITIDPTSPVESRRIYVSGTTTARRSGGWLIPVRWGGTGVKVSVDGGKTWQAVNRGLGRNLNVNYLVMHPSDPRILYAAVLVMKDGDKVVPGGLFVTRDGGGTWDRCTPAGVTNVGWIDIDKHNPNTVYIACSDIVKANYGYREFRDFGWIKGGVYRSDDGGETWRHIFMAQYCRFVAVSPHNPNIVFTSASNDGAWWLTDNPGVFKSDDAGKTWRKVNRGLSDDTVHFVKFSPHDPRVVWCGANSGWYPGCDRRAEKDKE